MDLDEFIFEKVSKFFKRKRKSDLDKNENIVYLDDIRNRLLLLSRAFTGLPIEIFHAQREGGYKDYNFFLPSSISIFKTASENLSFYFYRVIYLSLQQQLNLNYLKSDSFTDEEAQQNAVITSTQVLELMKGEFPIGYKIHEVLLESISMPKTEDSNPDVSWLYGKWMSNTNENKSNIDLENFDDTVKTATNGDPITTIQAKASEEIKNIQVDKKQQEDYVLTHNFEKVETAEEFDGVWRDFDGDDDLEKHQDALDELNMKLTVRVDDLAHSVYQADFIENSGIAESKEKGNEKDFIFYPEWDYSRRKYKNNFCKVYPEIQTSINQQYYIDTISSYQPVLTGIRKMLTSINNKRTQQRKQVEGPEFDLDALIDFYADVHAGITPTDKVYLSNRNKQKDIAILILLDTSLSSDSYSDGNRVIDVEKQVTILFGEILQEYNIDFSIASFYSKTRNYLSYNVFKQFNEPWINSKFKIGAAEPAGYTRIGAALRHAGSELSKQEAKNKWIILLSDGKPNDYDKYEGKYGIQDVKQALRELNEIKINSYALAIESRARYYLPQMFGQNHYRILSTPNELLQSLALIFNKIRSTS